MVKKQIIYGLLVITLITSCKAQKQDLKQDSMKTFDIETFDKNKVKTEYNFVIKDSTIVEQYESSFGGYMETIKPKNAYFYSFNRYYKSGKLKLTGKFFPNDFEKGIWKEYDQQGTLIKETDYDKPYKFTFEDVLKFIKKRNIDMSHYLFRIGRNVVDGKPVWGITYNKNEEKMILGTIGLDGITGEIIQERDKGYPQPD